MIQAQKRFDLPVEPSRAVSGSDCALSLLSFSSEDAQIEFTRYPVRQQLTRRLLLSWPSFIM